MATKPPNQSSTKEGSVTPKGKKASSKKAAPKAGGYDWGDGRNVHSIPLAQHQGNREGVQNYGLTPNTPLDQPLTAGQAYGMAQATAGRTYDPQINANRQLQTNTPVWYQNYINQTGTQQAALAAQSQPVLNTAQTAVTNAAATAPGLDPSSPQYAKEQQAALGRQVMAQDSANYLGGVAQAGQNYLSGQANVAARELPQAQAGLLSQYGLLQTQKQDAATAAYGDIRTGEQNASIARQTLGLNTAQAAADVDLKRGVDPVTGKDLPAEPAKGYAPGGPGLNKYGYTYDQWSAMSPAAQNKKRSAGSTTAADKDKQKKADAEKKRIAGVKTATAKIQTKISDAQAAWTRYAAARNPKTTLDPATGNAIPVIDPKTKKPVMVGATPDQIKAKLRKDGYTETEIHVMLMLRGKKKLTAAEVKALKSQDPNIRIPREWLAGKTAASTGDRYGAVGKGADTTS
jgi:hypothetical protein